MKQTISQMLHLMFVFTGLFACLYAWLNKWGAATAMIGFSSGAMAAGLALNGSTLALIPALVLGCILLLIWLWRRPLVALRLDDSEDPRAMSDRLLAEMNQRVAERKGLRKARTLFTPDAVRDHTPNS